MSARRVLAGSSTALAVALTGGLALLGVLSLRGTGLLAVGLAAVPAGCLGAGVVHRSGGGRAPRATVEGAWRAAAGTVAVLLGCSGAVVLAGAAAPGVVLAWVGAVALAWRLRRPDHRRGAAAGPMTGSGAARRPPVPPVRPGLPPVRPAAPADRRNRHPSSRTAGVPPTGPPHRPVDVPGPLPGAATGLAGLSTGALGREWLRTAAALESAGGAEARAQLVQWRREALDELECRDPAGFARWLAAGATVDSDPAQYVRGDSSAGSGAN